MNRAKTETRLEVRVRIRQLPRLGLGAARLPRIGYHPYRMLTAAHEWVELPQPIGHGTLLSPALDGIRLQRRL